MVQTGWRWNCKRRNKKANKERSLSPLQMSFPKAFQQMRKSTLALIMPGSSVSSWIKDPSLTCCTSPLLLLCSRLEASSSLPVGFPPFPPQGCSAPPTGQTFLHSQPGLPSDDSFQTLLFQGLKALGKISRSAAPTSQMDGTAVFRFCWGRQSKGKKTKNKKHLLLSSLTKHGKESYGPLEVYTNSI